MSDKGTLQAPFPWFGGKSRAAPLIWARLGNVANYVEPFAGSLAVLLSRPHQPSTETVNDLDCYLANFWRAVRTAPEETAQWADWPVNEADLHARHRWLLAQSEFRERMKADPHYHDAKIAGWWAWGLCSWIGSGWCVQRGDGPPAQRPHLGNAGMGLHRKLPHLGSAGMGIAGWLAALSGRLRRVRVACGDWTRVLGPSVTEKHGVTGILLDPPYAADEHSVTYGADGGDVAEAVRGWALSNGDNPLLRIALCGYDTAMPNSWRVEHWKAHGGYGSQGNGRGRENAGRETIWFSPHCIEQPSLFEIESEADTRVAVRDRGGQAPRPRANRAAREAISL